MNKATITTAERIAALEEQKDRLADRSALAQQMLVCALDRDRLADRLNEVIAERDRLVAEKKILYQFEANPGMKGAKAYLFVIADSKEEALDFLNQHELDFLYVFGQSDIIAEGNDKGVFETIYLNK